MTPPGLSHLKEALFREPIAVAAESRGVSLIAASGDVGEARLVARRIREWLAAGVPAMSIVVARRDLAAKEALLREVFEEYAVPAVWPTALPIARCGAVALLRKCWRLQAREFPFREVAAVWRNMYFRPPFEPELPLQAESLLRELNVPRDAVAYLKVLREWAEDEAAAPLEDESMERGRRKRRIELAKRCTPFLQWFFKLWLPIPASATPTAMVQQLKRLADELGLSRGPQPLPEDAAALEQLWAVLEARAAAAKRGKVTPAEFERVLTDIAEKTDWPRPVHEHGVRLVATTEAVPCSHLIVMGLGEGSFPQLGGNPAEYDAALSKEQAHFHTLVSNAEAELVLSYSALDAKGQAMLPSTFLIEIKKRFKTIETKTQTMLLDGYLSDAPLSPGEIRTQYAARPTVSVLPPEPVQAHLHTVKRMTAARRSGEPSPYSGGLSHPPVIGTIAAAFGTEKVFSPTSLETYIACPFKFWLESVLGVEPLEEPSEDVEVSRRGSAIHRALARYHLAKPHERPESLADELTARWGEAVDETLARTPSAPGKVLWSLERRRVQRSLNRYPAHWNAFRSGWQEKGATPLPGRFEAMFGYDTPAMTLNVDGTEVRIGGIIDRVDLASLDVGLGFWIIDYKTGRGTAFSTKDVASYERLQLPLYALAVERIFYANHTVRPLGLAYWLIVKDGPKRMLPAGRDAYAWAGDAEAWATYRDELERVVVRVAQSLRRGDFRLAPRHESSCDYCSFHTVCRINQQRGKLTPLPLLDAP